MTKSLWIKKSAKWLILCWISEKVELGENRYHLKETTKTKGKVTVQWVRYRWRGDGRRVP